MITPFTQTYRVRPYEIGPDHTLKTTALIDYFQDSAGEHADRLGVGMARLADDSLTWYAWRYHLTIARWPGLKEEVTLTTWPRTRKRLQAFRDFRAVDAEGHTVAAGSSVWVLVNTRTGRPTALDGLLSEFTDSRDRALETSFPKLPAPGDEEGTVRQTYRALREQMDVNRHVNNAVYLAWAQDAACATVGTMRPCEMEIAFKGESRGGDDILCETTATEHTRGTTTVHRLSNPNEGHRELARARLQWRQFQQ